MTPSIQTARAPAEAARPVRGDVRSEADKVRYATMPTSLGFVLVARSDKGVCAVLLGDDANDLADDLRSRMRTAKLKDGDEACVYIAATVAAHVEDSSVPLDFTLDAQGTPFQKRVWKALRAIPVGMTISYGELARQAGAPESVRAVASACGANPIALAVPCHRVVSKDGSLGGYRWGVERKR
ncbi:MAG TPA: methylated-DNA--[protein]-cysteine S-methyltransferase, partial [Steroidobacteraceae bacterium]|nr:methylated-DNA--[protein]-cysteine S-methyltransferase [Steroidobacteraceae bacterium]